MKLIVTGAGGGLGAATAALLERQGHEVARIVRNSASGDSLTIACDDLADAQAAEQSVGAAVEGLGGLDGSILPGLSSGRRLQQAMLPCGRHCSARTSRRPSTW